MEPSQFQRVEEVFHQARETEPAERAQVLDDLCDGDLELRAEVESLLAHANGEGLRRGDRDGGTGDTHLVERGPVAEGPGSRIGSYKILQKIGEGGFGVVYMAEQVTPVQRKVALKIIKLGMDTKQVIARFEAERQALALMDHPNIAKVLDAGATETGRPYFVMELVRGISLAEYCDKNRLTTEERLLLFLQVCLAVQHAHQKGIIHRDLKPSNVLVTLHDTKAVPKVIDFGIAKATSRQLTERTLFTEFRQFIGTPEYMSPDQAEISGLDVDTRTDIYSLGVILYELLTGTTPFDAETLRQASYGEIQRIIQEEEPPKPSTRVQTLMDSGSGVDIARHRKAEPGSFSRVFRGDLDWIVMKAMEKDRTRRYQSASELAADIERHLKQEPILAGPPSVLYKTRKFVLRHRVGVAAGLLISAALVVGLSTASVGLVRARREAQRSQRIADFLQDLFVSTDPDQALASGVNVEQVLNEARSVFGEDHATVAAVLGSRALQLQSSGDLEGAEKLYRESLDIWRSRFGDDNINVATTLSRLGMLEVTKGDDAAAEEALRDSLAITSRLPGDGLLTECDTRAQLAQVLVNRGEFEEAIELLRESIRLRKERAPSQHLQLALTYHGLVNVMSLSGDIDGVLAMAPEALDAWRAAIPPDSSLMARLMLDFGMAFYEFDRIDEAAPLVTKAANLLRNMGDNLLTYRVRAVRLCYRIAEKRNDPVAAIPYAEEGIELSSTIDDGQHLHDAVKELANQAWQIACDSKRSRDDYYLALDAVEKALVEEPDDPAYLNTLGVLRYRLGQYEDALATLNQSHEQYRKQYEYGVPADLAFMAMAHYKLGHEAEARATMEQLRLSMQNPAFALQKDALMHVAEAEALLGPMAPPTPAPPEAPESDANAGGKAATPGGREG